MAGPALVHCLGFTVAWRHGRPAGTCRWHRHDALELVLHLHGCGNVAHRGHPSLSFTAGACTLHPPQLLHTQTRDDWGEDLCLHFLCTGALPERLRRPLVTAPLPEHQRIWAAAQFPGDPTAEADRLAALALLASALAHATGDTGEPSDAHDPAQILLRRLQDRPDRRWRIAEIADAAGCTPRHLHRRCREAFGCAPKALHRRLRLQRAGELLEHSELTLAEIAMQCGYAHARHLCADFRAARGTTPGRWRQDPNPSH